MNRTVISSLSLALILAVGALAQSNDAAASAAPSGPTGVKATAKTAKPAGYPFRGKLKAVDQTAKTLTLAGKDKDRVFHVTAETKFTKAGKPVALTDGAKEEEVAGYAKTGTDGRAEAVTVRFGPAPEGSKSKSTAKKAAAQEQPAPVE